MQPRLLAGNRLRGSLANDHVHEDAAVFVRLGENAASDLTLRNQTGCLPRGASSLPNTVARHQWLQSSRTGAEKTRLAM